MKTYGKTVAAGLLSLALMGSALAEAPAPKEAAGSAPVIKADSAGNKDAAPVGETREQLLEELKKANAQLAEDKKAMAAAKGDAAKAAKDKVKADGKRINEINMKLHKLKTSKKPVPKSPEPIPPPAT
ncbi:MAG: hypothetical protein U0745_03285 [Polyangia bacterium]|jgi:protein-tyrosine-phosphatase